MDKKVFLVLKTAEKPDVDYTEDVLEQWARNDEDYNNSESIIKIDASKYENVNDAIEGEMGCPVSEIINDYRVYGFNFDKKVVYVVRIHQVSECEDLGIRLEVFANVDDARKYLKDWRDDEMQYVERDEWKVFTDEPDHFEASQIYDWNNNHSEGVVEECEVK